jgi:hypothetical protein
MLYELATTVPTKQWLFSAYIGGLMKENFHFIVKLVIKFQLSPDRLKKVEIFFHSQPQEGKYIRRKTY